MGGEIRKLQRDQVRLAVETLARAFHDDPIVLYLFRRERRRPAAIRAFMAGALGDALPFDEVHAAVDGTDVLGIAAWLPPRANPQSVRRQLRQLPSLARVATIAPGAAVGLRMIAAMQRVHPHDEHWYLHTLGVDPADQGRGLGGRLLEPVLARADDADLPCYLETAKEKNLAWYARHGFATRSELRPTKTGPPVWTMWRDARATS